MIGGNSVTERREGWFVEKGKWECRWLEDFKCGEGVDLFGFHVMVIGFGLWCWFRVLV